MDDLTKERYTRTPAAEAVKAPTAGPVHLTAGQLDVLHLTAQGLTYGQIGHLRHLAASTVKSRLRRVYLALGARTAAHAVHIAHQRGLLGGKRVGGSHQPATAGNVATSTQEGRP